MEERPENVSEKSLTYDDMLGMLNKYMAARSDAMRDEVSDMVIVDTCNATSRGWETAISIDGDKSYVPVELYPSREAAALRHPYWVERATKGITEKELAGLHVISPAKSD
jgi:hypothetical protein